MRESEKFSEVARRKIVMEVLSGTLTKEQARHVYGITYVKDFTNSTARDPDGNRHRLLIGISTGFHPLE